MHDDGRSKKIALLAHCLLNQQAKVGGLARFPAQIPDIAQILEEYNFSIIQMPCPEMYAAGLRRWGHVKNQYACAGYRQSFRRAAEFFVDTIMDYVQEDYTIVMIGIDGSPSCGVNITEFCGEWGGSMMFYHEITEPRVEGNDSGVWIDVLNEVFKERGIGPFPTIGLPLDMGDGRVDPQMLRDFLKDK